MKQFLLVLALVLTCVVLPADVSAAEQPNILWITAEDMSPTLGCYGDDYAITPHIDRFAKRGVLYTHAFASAPVCSPSRACLINGLPATSQGTQQMRSAFPIPTDMKGFPSLLRKAGYFTSNNVKTDYNSANWKRIVQASWDRQGPNAHWRQRPGGKPFFSIFNLMVSHQSRTMVWPYEQFQKEVQSKLSAGDVHDPAKAPVPSYYPDTPVVRKMVARFYDCVTAMDMEVGEILKQLETDGLVDDTIVFFYSDHGSGMPRHKRVLLDSGMKVPMLIHFPRKWRHLASGGPGTSLDRLVNFADFAPTVLNLAGVAIPEFMEGLPFLGPGSERRHQFVLGHRDRIDEAFDMARSVRDKRYLYVRNFMPHLGYRQPSAWPDVGDISGELETAVKKGKLTPAQSHFMGERRPIEELYDCEQDPLNLNNLAGSPNHVDRLRKMRRVLKGRTLARKDLGFLPETLAWERSLGTTPYEMARKDYNLEKIFRAANHVGIADQETFVDGLSDSDAAVRYWAAVGLTAVVEIEASSVKKLEAALKDRSVSVRVQAADALARHGHADQALVVLEKALDHERLSAVLHAARTIELLGRTALPLVDAIRRTDARIKLIGTSDTSAAVFDPGEADMAMFVGFSTGAFLDRFRR